ncbi:MAG: Arylsulfatase [Pseudomonadota bacterium]
MVGAPAPSEQALRQGQIGTAMQTLPHRPNIIFVLADDLGYADLGCYGARLDAAGPVSPHLDRLAGQGLKFHQGYANSPVCSPTRFALMTGRYQYRHPGGCEEPISVKSRGSTRLGLPPGLDTLPGWLKVAGYRTALIGKWHLGYAPAFGPLKSGYEEFFGPMSGGIDYFSHCSNGGVHDLYSGEEEVHADGYLTDLLTDRALAYIDRMAGNAADSKPFFLSLHYTAPHFPWQSRDDHALPDGTAGGLFHLDGGSIPVYRRMIQHMDEGIGRIWDRLVSLGIQGNTLIVFTSDNGGERFSDNWPLVGGKMDLTEGGIRVPWIAHWPAVIDPGGTSQQHCMSMDWSATLLALAGVPQRDEWDGVSLVPVLKDAGHRFPRPLYWRMNHRGQRAYRLGDWKYLRVDGHDYLFNLAHDERERANLSKRHPDRLRAMRQAWEDWEAEMPATPPDATVTLGFSQRDMPQR